MRIVPAHLRWPDPGAAFSAAMQLAALAAVVSYFWVDVRFLRYRSGLRIGPVMTPTASTDQATGSVAAFFAIWGLLRILENLSSWPFVVYRGLIDLLLIAGTATGLFS